MGQHSNKNKKKKKKGSIGGTSGRRNNRWSQSTECCSFFTDENELVTDEITALCGIFQEDCEVIQVTPPQIIIKLRPYSIGISHENRDVSALLSVRFVPGYPFKCPKLQITEEGGLARDDADKLLSLLQDLANLIAREGRVMIFNLVDAAQEFLSGLIPATEFPETVTKLPAENECIESPRKKKCSVDGPFVYGFVDIFSGCGESWSWELTVDHARGVPSSEKSLIVKSSNNATKDQNVLEKPVIVHAQNSSLRHPSVKDKLWRIETDGENEMLFNTDSDASEYDSFLDSKAGVDKLERHSEVVELEDDDHLVTSTSLSQDQGSGNFKQDLILAHLLRLACASKETLNDSLSNIVSELCDSSIISKGVQELVSKPSSVFSKMFEDVFHQQRGSSRIAQFWKPAYDMKESQASLPGSRYLYDFEELRLLGHGGFGHVVLCKNKLDGRQYAVKKIRLKDKIIHVNDYILREVATLSRLQHQHVVRYYQAWCETGLPKSFGETGSSADSAGNSTFSYKMSGSEDVESDSMVDSTYLYIQMEYCPRTLRQVFESYNHFDMEVAWHWFRQIVEGLAHIHGQGILHRDLTPNNIFFDSRNDIKIGDFGLAKFLQLEQLDLDAALLGDTPGVSIDGTGQVGTYFYTAPEIEQGWPKIDQKADMYSLGVVFFEIWHPFGTSMERYIKLSELKQKGELPASWVTQYPEQASLLRRLMSAIPSDRPSATDLLKNDFPPRMEYDLLDSMLKTMHTSEDRSVYDKVVDAIFDDEAFVLGSHHQHVGRLRINKDDTSSIQCTELRDYVFDAVKEVFKLHCGKHLEVAHLHLIDDYSQSNRLNTLKLLTRGGDLIELSYELRYPFINWLVANQKFSFRRYEISSVYRKAIGHSAPNCYLQGDFDIVGGSPALTEAEVVKVTVDSVSQFISSDTCDILINHGDLLEAIWSWVGINPDQRQKVAEFDGSVAASIF